MRNDVGREISEEVGKRIVGPVDLLRLDLGVRIIVGEGVDLGIFGAITEGKRGGGQLSITLDLSGSGGRNVPDGTATTLTVSTNTGRDCSLNGSSPERRP
jgi:hypothetical protein